MKIDKVFSLLNETMDEMKEASYIDGCNHDDVERGFKIALLRFRKKLSKEVKE